MNQAAKNPLSTAQNLTTAGLDREIADIIVGAIHESHSVLAKSHANLAKNQVDLERRIEETRADLKVSTAETHAMIYKLETKMSESHRQMGKSIITWVLSGMALMLAFLKYFGGV